MAEGSEKQVMQYTSNQPRDRAGSIRVARRHAPAQQHVSYLKLGG
jgi:hypothetical protein